MHGSGPRAGERASEPGGDRRRVGTGGAETQRGEGRAGGGERFVVRLVGVQDPGQGVEHAGSRTPVLEPQFTREPGADDEPADPFDRPRLPALPGGGGEVFPVGRERDHHEARAGEPALDRGRHLAEGPLVLEAELHLVAVHREAHAAGPQSLLEPVVVVVKFFSVCEFFSISLSAPSIRPYLRFSSASLATSRFS